MFVFRPFHFIILIVLFTDLLYDQESKLLLILRRKILAIDDEFRTFEVGVDSFFVYCN
jgi:hypothetical protein